MEGADLGEKVELYALKHDLYRASLRTSIKKTSTRQKKNFQILLLLTQFVRWQAIFSEIGLIIIIEHLFLELVDFRYSAASLHEYIQFILQIKMKRKGWTRWKSQNEMEIMMGTVEAIEWFIPTIRMWR